jgi:hypothetical protein
MSLLTAAAENREASPIALVVILLLVVALVVLIRSMNKHLRKVPDSFTRPEQRPDSAGEELPAPERTPADPDGPVREHRPRGDQ